MSRNNKPFFFFLSCALSAGLFSCGGGVHHIDYAYGYGTNWTIHLYEGKITDVEDIIAYISKTSRILDAKSTISGGLGQLNANRTVTADPFLLEAIQLGQSVEARSHGAYSIRLGKLTSAWKDALDEGKALSEETYAPLALQAQETRVEVESSVITIQGDGDVDLSSLGKGLCLRHIRAQLKEKGITKYFIDGGQSSLLFGSNPSETGETKVRLKDVPSRYFTAKDCAVSCSSISEQKKTIDGVTYSHIVDPRTGLAKVTTDALYLRGDDPGLLDALSTAYMILGKDYAKELEDEKINAAYVMSGEVAYASEGFLA